MKGKVKIGKAKFEVPSEAEIAEVKKRKMDGETAEILQHIDGVMRGWLNIRLYESRIKFRLTQLGRDVKGNEIDAVHILEKFNDAIKPLEMLEAELNIDVFNYKELIAAVSKDERYLLNNGFDKAHILDMKKGSFSMSEWLDKREEEAKKQLGETQ